MLNLEKLINGIKAILKFIFGDQVPDSVYTLINYVLIAALFLIIVWALLEIISKIVSLWMRNRTCFTTLKKNAARFVGNALHAMSNVKSGLNDLEEWRDHRFAELEAEVEAEGRRRTFNFLPFLQGTRTGLRRERSLSKALEVMQSHIFL